MKWLRIGPTACTVTGLTAPSNAVSMTGCTMVTTNTAFLSRKYHVLIPEMQIIIISDFENPKFNSLNEPKIKNNF